MQSFAWESHLVLFYKVDKVHACEVKFIKSFFKGGVIRFLRVEILDIKLHACID